LRTPSGKGAYGRKELETNDAVSEANVQFESGKGMGGGGIGTAGAGLRARGERGPRGGATPPGCVARFPARRQPFNSWLPPPGAWKPSS